jgi:hypothetical protein
MLEVLQNQKLRQQMVINASVYSDINSWSRRKADYLAIVDDLVARRTTIGRIDGVASPCASELA